MANMSKTLYKRLIETYGEKQLIVALEEFSELQKVICKYMRNGQIEKENIIEEVVDVEIMLEQIKIYFNLSKLELEEEKDRKIKRTRMRLFNDYINK